MNKGKAIENLISKMNISYKNARESVNEASYYHHMGKNEAYKEVLWELFRVVYDEDE